MSLVWRGEERKGGLNDARVLGVAVLSYAYVDSVGYGLPILPTDPLDPHDGFSTFFRSGFTFESLTRVSQYETMGRKKAAPPTLLQFAIWERGEVGIVQLSAHLEKSIKRAICDLVTEYGLMTAPLLEGTYLDGTFSEPHSPTSGRGKDLDWGGRKVIEPLFQVFSKRRCQCHCEKDIRALPCIWRLRGRPRRSP